MIEIANGNPSCAGCGGEPYLQATIPDPVLPGGQRTVSLCPSCPAETPAARTLAAWFAAHQTIEMHNAHQVAPMMHAWIAEASAANGCQPNPP
jgi:hypothetical protein